MKLTNAQRKRLATLLSKRVADLTPDEFTEMNSLKAIGAAEGIKFDDAWITESAKLEADDNTALTDEQIGSLVKTAMTDTLTAKGITAEAIEKAVKEGNKGHITAEGIKAAVKEATEAAKGDGDTAKIVDGFKAALAESQKGALTVDALTAALANFVTANGDRKAALMQHPEGDSVSGVVEHRLGNLTVAQKQLLNVCLDRPQDEGIKANVLLVAEKAGTKMLDGFRLYGTKALTTSGSGSGSEIVPTTISADIQARMYLESQFAAAMTGSEITMPSSIYQIPLTTTRPSFYVGSEAPGSDPTESDPGTAGATLTSAKLIGVSSFSYEIDEDSVVPVLPMIQTGLAQGAAASLEGALINGDTTATHMDSDYHAISAHHAKLLKGLRKYALAGSITSSFATGGITASNIGALRKMLGKWGIMPSQLLALVGPKGYNDLVQLPETLTVDKAGPQARILTGQVASIYGIPIIVSEQMRENLNASGVYDGTTTTKGSFLLVNKSAWFLGVRRQLTIELDQDKKRQTKSVICSFRRAFMPMETPSTSIPLVGLGYNFNS